MSDEMPASRRVGQALQPWQEVGVGREAAGLRGGSVEGSDEMPAPRRVGRALQPWQEVGVGREARTATPSLVCGIDSVWCVG